MPICSQVLCYLQKHNKAASSGEWELAPIELNLRTSAPCEPTLTIARTKANTAPLTSNNW